MNESEKYMNWINWTKQNKELNPLTRNQALFAEFLLENDKIVSSIGDMESVFLSIRDYLKHKK